MHPRSLFALCSLALALTACSGPADIAQTRSQTPRQPLVLAESVEFAPAVTRAEAVGTSRARLSTDIYPASSGEVVSVHFEPGAEVDQGDVLVELDARRERLAVEMAELRFDEANRLYERYSRSAASGAVDANTLDTTRTAFEIAKVELEQARVALADRTIRAPFAGYVGTTDVDPGDRVSQTTLITTLDDRAELFVRFALAESFIGELDIGESVELGSISRGALRATGTIVDIGSRIDPDTRTFEARARVDNSDDRLRPGMSFRVSVAAEGESYAVVAETAVQWGTDGAFVWTVEDGKASLQPVQVIQRRNGTILVDGDFSQGDIVVVEGTQRVRSGSGIDYRMDGQVAGGLANGGDPSGSLMSD